MANSKRFCANKVFFLGSLLCVISSAHGLTESTPGCGKIDESLRGRDPRVEVPWVASIFYQSSQCDFRPGTSGQGIIIGPTTIITSGHFLWSSSNPANARLQQYKPSHFMVAVGLKAKHPLTVDHHTQFLKISSIRSHPKAYAKYSSDDFIIIHLENPIKFTSYVRPICLETSPEAELDSVNSTYKLGELSIGGFRQGQLSLQPFGILDSSICTAKLETEYDETNQAKDLKKMEVPCGLASKSREDVQSWSGYGSGLIQARFMDFAQIARISSKHIIPNICFQKGSAIVTNHDNRWFLVGMTTESLGSGCDNASYFISLVTLRKNLNWILKNIWFSSSGFVCDNNQVIEAIKVCNEFQDCEDGSDETSNYCDATSCNSLFSMFCKYQCPHRQDSFVMLRKTYNFSTAITSEEKKCPPLFQPSNSLLHCENPHIRQRISCAFGSESGTKAVFQCKTTKAQEPSSYCVITCKDDGNWTDELSSYVCKADQPTKAPPTVADLLLPGVNHTPSSNWIHSIFHKPGDQKPSDQQAGGSTSGDDSLETWIPPSYPTHINVGDKTGLITNGTNIWCSAGFLQTPGVKMTCRDPDSTRLKKCEGVMMPPGSKAEFRCDSYYAPVFKASSITKTCLPNGRWTLEDRTFLCNLGMFEPKCGLPKNSLVGHIVHGQVSEGSKWPWHATVFRKSSKGSLEYICGATLISRRLLLTAAHCVSGHEGTAKNVKNYEVILGATSNVYMENVGDPHAQILQVDNITVHEAYNPRTFESDIAILRLDKPVTLSELVRPSCFPSTLTTHTELLQTSAGSKGYIVGFGYDESGRPSTQLKETVLPVVTFADCFEVSKIQASPVIFCAGYTNGTAACNGDSGGGMFFEDDSSPRRYYLQGIVSHGNRDETTNLCDQNKYSVFTKVSIFKDWIYQIGQELDSEFK